ncbi:MAG: ATP-binding cassette domain-containing protein [Acidimicrobiales bacterium]
MAEEVLTFDGVTMAFGSVVALNDVSIAVHRGQIFGIIGPNGASKTALFNCVTGVFEHEAHHPRREDDHRPQAPPHHRGRVMDLPEHPLFPHDGAPRTSVGTGCRR